MKRNKMDFLPDYLDDTETEDEQTLEYKRQFKIFCDNLSDHLINFEYEDLYELSDKSMEKEIFVPYIQNQIGGTIEQICKSYDECSRGIILTPTLTIQSDLYLLIGTLDLFIYIKHHDSSSLSSYLISYIRTYKTKLYFTYKNNDFRLMPMFRTFDMEDVK